MKVGTIGVKRTPTDTGTY